MLGYRRTNLDLANKLYCSPVEVEFIRINELRIEQLMHNLKMLKYGVRNYYNNDELLNEETNTFINTCSKVVSTIESYSEFFMKYNGIIVNYFTFVKKNIYEDLFNEYVTPIIELIRDLRVQDNNAYMDTLKDLIKEKYSSSKNIYIIIKEKTRDDLIKINGYGYKIMDDKNFANSGVFADVVIFIGTPGYYKHNFSTVFYGKKTIFLGYSCFENRLVKRMAFSDLINPADSINTIYNGVTFETGYSGLDFNRTFTTEKEEKSKESLIKKFEHLATISETDKLEVKLATISKKNYIFLPIRQKINVIDKDSLKILQVEVKELSVGDLLIFRDQNATGLVREEADKILGVNAVKYRKSLEMWKKRLFSNVKSKGIEKVSRILRKRYGISVAKENNIKNWMSTHSIKPSCLDKLLEAFKFNNEEKIEILNAAHEILSAHISAGHNISRSLMKELDKNLESVIDENGYYSFESKEFEGAFFNIEEIKNISKDTFFIPEKEALKIIKG